MSLSTIESWPSIPDPLGRQPAGQLWPRWQGRGGGEGADGLGGLVRYDFRVREIHSSRWAGNRLPTLGHTRILRDFLKEFSCECMYVCSGRVEDRFADANEGKWEAEQQDGCLPTEEEGNPVRTESRGEAAAIHRQWSQRSGRILYVCLHKRINVRVFTDIRSM